MISALEDGVEVLKKEMEDISLLATYVELLEQMDRFYAALNQTFSDLSISLQVVIVIPKRREAMKEIAELKQRRS